MHVGDCASVASEHCIVPAPQPMQDVHDMIGEGGGVCGDVHAPSDQLDGCDAGYGMFANFGSDGSDTDFSDDFDNEVEDWIQQEGRDGNGCASPRITFLMNDMVLERPDSIMCLPAPPHPESPAARSSLRYVHHVMQVRLAESEGNALALMSSGQLIWVPHDSDDTIRPAPMG